MTKPAKFSPLSTKPNLNPKPFDPNDQTFVPDRSLDSSKIRSISVRKIQMIGAKVYRATTQNIADDGDYHAISFSTESFDQGDLWKAGDPTKLTIPYDGIWTLSAFASMEAANGGTRRFQLIKNASTTMLTYVNKGPSGALDDDFPVLISDYSLTAGDYITAQVFQNSGGGIHVQAGEENNFLSAVFRGPI